MAKENLGSRNEKKAKVGPGSKMSQIEDGSRKCSETVSGHQQSDSFN